MFSKKRRKRKLLRSKKNVFVATVFFLFFFAVVLLSLILFFSNSSYYISPIPNMFSKNPKDSAFENASKEKLEMLLGKNKISYSSVLKRKDFFMVKLKTDEEILISSKKPLEVQVSSLQLVINRLTIEGKPFKSLDFRFDQPVIVF